MCLHAVEKYEKVESVNTQNDYAATSKKRNSDLFFVFCK